MLSKPRRGSEERDLSKREQIFRIQKRLRWEGRVARVFGGGVELNGITNSENQKETFKELGSNIGGRSLYLSNWSGGKGRKN